MDAQTERLVNKYLAFSGERTYNDFQKFLSEILTAKAAVTPISKEYKILEYLQSKAVRGMYLCKRFEKDFDFINVTVDEDSIEDIEDEIKKQEGLKGVFKKKAKKKKGGDLGKLVDHGKVSPNGNSDNYWRRSGIDLVFKPDDEKVRVGSKIPDTYKYADVRYLENYYGLRAFEFGNWLSQQDRVNYLSGLGLALFDMYKALDFKPEQISIKNKLAVAFGARGRGKALAHFEPGSFTINLTRYSRPAMVENRPSNFRRVNEILKDGGVGSFAHEYGHALDYYGGLHVEKGDTFCLSGDDSTHTTPNWQTMKAKTLHGAMERLMYKIIFSDAKGKKFTPYYERLKKGGTRKYFLQRNEIFARAFEVYVHYKLDQDKYKNIFLNKTKYPEKYYLKPAEMKRVIPEFDALMNGIKKHL